MNILYRLYHSIPAKTRLPIIQSISRTATKSGIVNLIWNKLILRYHYLYGKQNGLTVELTDKCNLKCTYCPKSLDIGIKGGFMDWDLFVKAVDGASSERKVAVFNLVGFGEPFLYPRLVEAISYIRQKNPDA